jgi:TRAP-type C4-dicarboxylate transport system substrate-binding protein
MKTNRKMTLIVVAALLLAFALGACGGNDASGEAEAPPADATEENAVAQTDDGGPRLADYDRAGTAATDGRTPTSVGAPLAPEPVIVPIPAGAEGKTWDLKADEQGMDDMAMLKNERDAFEHIRIRTNGQVNITLYPNSTLLPFESKFSGVVQGLADLSIYMADINEGTQPINSVLGVFHSAPAGTTQEVSKLYRDFVRANPIFEEENAAKGVVWLTNWALAPCGIHFTKGDVRVPSDMKGHKTLSVTTQVDYVEAAGGAALVTSIGDYYTSLEKGVADSILAHWPIMHEFKLTDLIKNSVIFSDSNDYAGLGNSMQGWLANKAVWDSIPAEYQQVIREELDWAADATAYDNDNQVKTAIEYAESIGVKINRLTQDEAQQWYDLTATQRDNWAEYATRDTNLSQEDAYALYDDFQAAIKNKGV